MSEQDQEELFNANYSLAASCVVKICGKFDEDLHQEALEALWKAAGHFDKSKGTKFKAYAAKVIRNQLIDVGKKARAKRRDTSNNTSLDSRLGDDHSQIMGMEDIHVDVEGLKHAVTKREWRILVLRLRGYKIKEIAAEVGCSDGNVKATLDHVRKVAREFI